MVAQGLKTVGNDADFYAAVIIISPTLVVFRGRDFFKNQSWDAVPYSVWVPEDSQMVVNGVRAFEFLPQSFQDTDLPNRLAIGVESKEKG